MFEVAPPVRIVAVVTLFASTFDLLADFLLCARIAEFVGVFQSDLARYAAYGYFFFTVVPLPALLYVLFTNEPRLSIANPVLIASWIKLVALTWGLIKFTKLRFFWPCLPLNPKHETRENFRRCFQFTPYRLAMIFINICHGLAIFIVINNIIVSSKGGRPIVNRND
uniref:Uncharacterized protein n=1 Tax=Plectus sambesii TaxID=2011161 RepID=A0A914USL3_9BILA